MIAKYQQLPQWVRWALLFPLSAVFSIICILILSIIREDFVFIHSIVAIVSFIAAIHVLAPRWNNQLVIASLMLRMAFSIAVIGFIYYKGEVPNQRTSFEGLREVLGWIAGWAFYWKVLRTGESIS